MIWWVTKSLDKIELHVHETVFLTLVYEVEKKCMMVWNSSPSKGCGMPHKLKDEECVCEMGYKYSTPLHVRGCGIKVPQASDSEEFICEKGYSSPFYKWTWYPPHPQWSWCPLGDILLYLHGCKIIVISMLKSSAQLFILFQFKFNWQILITLILPLHSRDVM